MDDIDHAMQAELASQAGSVGQSDKMELEQDDINTVRDTEMEVHDVEAEGTIEDMKAAIASDDAEMTAEMQEQEHMQAERDWKDLDASVEVVPLNDGAAQGDALERTTPMPIEAPPSQDIDASEQLEDVDGPGNGITDSETGNVQAVIGTESGQQTLEQSMGSSLIVPQSIQDGADSQREDQPKARQDEEVGIGAPSEPADAPAAGETALERSEGDKYADASGDEADDDQGRFVAPHEPVASTSAVLVEDYQSALINASRYRRPALQKDYLAHVEVFSGDPPSLKNGSTGLAAPHVSLLYNNDFFSLFRPSSVPSGDDEKVLFAEDEDQQLYYSSLDSLIAKIHEAFPQFRGDGDNELILEFDILDMQISEDNVYTQQLSLHDFDRIRVGMGQPELDRLQITLLAGKRFVYKFNELAEHVYRMHAGSEYDSGTIYDETAEDEEITDEIPEYFDEGAAEEDAFRTAEEAQTAETEAEEARLEAEDGALPEEAKPDELAQVTYDQGAPQDEVEEEPIEYPDDEEQDNENTDNVPYDLEEEDPAPGQEIHPPSDEYYEDPEFSQQVAEAEEADEGLGQEGGEEEEEDEYTAGEPDGEGDGSETIRDYEEDEVEDEVGGHGESEEAEAQLAIDPDAPLDEVAEQIEEFEEGTFEREEDVEAEAEAARHEDVVASTTSVNVEAVDRDTERIYEGMDSLAAEEQGKVDPYKELSTTIAPELPVKRTNSIGKRNRDEEEDAGSADTNGQVDDVVAESLSNGEHTKRPKTSPDA